MTERKYRTYTEEFKKEALELLANSNKSAAEIERELGITQGLLVKWRNRYQIKKKNGEATLEASDLEAALAENRKLRRQLAIAEEERDILKKAVSIFSKKGR